jgi:hypothetical protein
MKNIKSSFVIILAIALLALTAFSVMAADGDDVILPCAGDADGKVSGTVVAVDGNTVTIHTGDGNYCTVTLNGSYDHPIVSLLGMYFGDISAESLLKALEDVNTEIFKTCAVYDSITDTWSWQKEGDCLGEEVTVLSTDADGNVVALTSGGEIIHFLTNPDYAKQISDELAKVFVEWTVDENGDLVQVSDQIAAYHADGMGFGVLVKLYALAQDSEGELSVEDLVAEFNSGVGMGQIFKEYGKPSKLGVGHVRHLKDMNGDGDPDSIEDGDQQNLKKNGKPVKANNQNKQNNQNNENKQKGYCKPNNGKGKGRPGC